jgi:membrane fusion protein (multidrug efflux system)
MTRTTHTQFLLGALALTLGTIACGRGGTPAVASADAAMVVGRENITLARQETLQVGPAIAGTLEADRTAQVRAEVGGAVVAIEAEPGQPVIRGQVLARIDDSGLRDSYTSSAAAARSAELNAGLARRNAERSRALAQAGALADRDREQAEWTLSNAEAQLEDAKARMANAEKQLAKTVLRAPFSGVVSERPASLGDIVQNGTSLFTIVDPATLKLEGAVEADALDGLKVGTPVTFAIHGADKPITGRISRINPALDPATRQVRVTVALPNTGRGVVSGLFAEGRVATSTRVGVVVPNGAVDRKGLKPFVVRIRGGKVERVDVELGMIDAAREQMEVLNGLAGGDTLLLGGARGITPGAAVQVGNASEKE